MLFYISFREAVDNLVCEAFPKPSLPNPPPIWLEAYRCSAKIPSPGALLSLGPATPVLTCLDLDQAPGKMS